MRLPLPVVLATGNTDKAREIIEILVDHSDEPLVAWAVTVGTSTFGYLLDGPDAIAATVENTPAPVEAPDVEETGDTLEANARIKASALAGVLGVPAISDDTGLEVDALDGAPVVYSARYAGEGASYADNVDKLLAALGERVDRGARFATVAMARWPDGREIAVRGEVEVRSRASLGAGAGSATTPCSYPRKGTAARLRR
jgi:XTP/dITP diphosphohydrolase